MLANHVFWRLMLFYTHLLLLLQPSVLWLSIVTFNNDAKPPPKWILREFDVSRIRPRVGGLPHLETFTRQNFGCRMSEVRCRISDVGCQISDVGCRMSNLGCRMSDVESRMPDFGCQMRDVGCRMSNVGCRMSDVECRISDVECQMSNLGRPMSDGTYKLPYDCTKYPKTMTAHKTEILNMLPYCKNSVFWLATGVSRMGILRTREDQLSSFYEI